MAKNQHMGLGNLVSEDYGYTTQPQVSMIGVNPSVTDKLGQIQATRSSPLSVSSGYRSPGYNRAVGGARKSQHVLGNAIDISTAGMSRAEVKSLAQEASRVGFRGIGIYSNSLHFDVRAQPAVWGENYSKTSVPGWAKDFATAHIKNEYQGTAPAPMVAAVERQSLPAVGPVPEARPQTTLASIAPQNVPTPTAKSAFTPGGIVNAPKVSLSPVSSAQAAPAQAAPAPSMAQSPVAAARTAPSIAPAPSRFGPVSAPNVNNAPSLKSALQAQAAQINAPAPQNVSAISSLRSLSPTASQQTAPQQAPTQAPSSFTETPSSYQTAAFSKAAPKMDAFGQPPAPGLQPAAPSPFSQAPAPQQAAPSLAAPTRTISSPKVASVPDETATIDAPAPDPSLNSFPDKPAAPGLFSGMFSKATPAGLLGQLAGVGIGTAAMGPLGGIVGGLLGKSLANNAGGSLGGLLSNYNGPTTNVGSGLGAMSSVLGGGLAPGSTAFSRSMPGMSVTSLPGGAIQRTNQFGMTQITTADGRTGRATKGRTGGAGGNYGGVKSEGARNAIDHDIGGLF